MHAQHPDLDVWRKRLLYQSWYRGTKETDLLLGPFATVHLPQCDAVALQAYEDFLKENDVDIFNWLTDRTPRPEDIDADLFSKLYAFWHRKP